MKIFGHHMRRMPIFDGAFVYVLAKNKAEATEKVEAVEKEYCRIFGQTYEEPHKKGQDVWFLSQREYERAIRNTKYEIAALVKEIKALPPEDTFTLEFKERALSMYRKQLAALENPIV